MAPAKEKEKAREQTAVTIAPRPEQVVEAMRTQSAGLLAESEAFQADTIEQAQGGAALLARISTATSALNTRRMEITRPLDAAKRSVMDLFAPLLTKLEEADKSVRKGMLSFETRRRQEEEKALRVAQAAKEKALREEQERADAAKAAVAAGIPAEKVAEMLPAAPVVPVIPVAAPAVVRADSGAGVTYVDVWKFEVTDVVLLPSAFVVANESAIRKAIQQGQRQIPGVRIWSEQEVRRA